MQKGGRGQYVIPWAQVKINGASGAEVSAVRPGVVWQWTGQVADAGQVFGLQNAQHDQTLRAKRRAQPQRRVQRLWARGHQPNGRCGDPIALGYDDLVVTDGCREWRMSMMYGDRHPIVLFDEAMPPRDVPLWVVKCRLGNTVAAEAAKHNGGVICFTPGTLIATPDGPRDVMALSEGDQVQTQDNGAAEILWIGRRLLTSARLAQKPHLRPIRLRQGALDQGVPDAGLLVSPDHRVVLRGPRTRALFHEDEVLVSARDLIDDAQVLVDHTVAHVVYIHMMLAEHQVVFANNVATETFHPASAALASLRVEEQQRLLARVPQIKGNASAYGSYARRCLTESEAAILRSDMTGRAWR